MLALSRDHQQVFLFEPGLGLAVPILLDLHANVLRIAFPEVDELEEDFASVDELDDIKESVPSHRKLIDAAAAFSRFYSDHFEDKINRGDITIDQLSTLINKHYSRIESAPAKLAPQDAGVAALAAFDTTVES